MHGSRELVLSSRASSTARLAASFGRVTRQRPDFIAPYWTLAIPMIVLSVYIAAEPERRLTMSMMAAVVYAATQWLLPKSRLRRMHYMGPVNIALVLLLVKIILAPVLLMLVGPEKDLNELLTVPSTEAMEWALAIDTVSYVAFCLGLSLLPEKRPAGWSASVIASFSRTPSRGVIALFGALGLAGFALTFRSLAQMLDYLQDSATMKEVQQAMEGSWSGLLSTVCRPFLGFALVAWWARSADANRWRNSARRPLLSGVVAGIGIAAANSTFSFNRAAFVFPLICLIAVYSARVRRIRPALLCAGAAAALPLLMAIGPYRAALMSGARTGEAELFVVDNIAQTVQGYATGPSYSGLFYENIEWGDKLGGSTLLASALSPVPVLGKSFRENNGQTVYNRALYGVSLYSDQIISFAAELFVNLHVPGVVAGFVLLGLALARAESWFTATSSAFGAFAIQYASLWAATLTLWSLSIFTQIMIYFFGPIYLYWAAHQARVWLQKTARSHRVVAYGRLSRGGTR